MADQDRVTRTTQEPTGVWGGLAIAAVVILVAFAIGASTKSEGLAVFLFIIAVLVFSGIYTLQPNEAAVITQFGSYIGSDLTAGLRWMPFWVKRTKISLRVRNVTSETLKVNDKQGNPVEVAANILWRVSDSAQATFDVDDYAAFIMIQIESALREVTRQYAYDHGDDAGEPTLRADSALVSERLREDLRARVAVAGIGIDETHLMHLAYAPEIASAMLRRQQAQAVIAARKLIVSGAVSMVEDALKQMSEREIVVLDEERRATMVSNLLVVLCGDRDAQPVLNTGTLYG